MSKPRTFPRGGVRLPAGGRAAASLPIRKACVPAEAIVPLRQHAGAPARCLVRAGQAVEEGMRLGQASGPMEADVHAPIPGVVKEIREILLPGGRPSPAVVIALAGEFRCTGRARNPEDWQRLSREELLRRVEACGVVGLDGVPVATRLREAGRARMLAVDGAQSEPYLNGDERLLMEKPTEVFSGAAVAAAILGAGDVRVAVLEDRPEALRAASEAAAGFGFQVVELAARYPQGEEGLLVQALRDDGSRFGEGPRSGAVVLNVGTLLAVHEAVALCMPHIERVVTVAGEGVPRPANLKARVGSPVSALLEECGAVSPAMESGRVVAGGLMRGWALDSLETPLTKGLTGIAALSRRELRAASRTPCINCGRCARVCPWGLRPSELFKLLERGLEAEARRRGLGECRECGCCAYVCPARIPLAQGLGASLGRGAA